MVRMKEAGGSQPSSHHVVSMFISRGFWEAVVMVTDVNNGRLPPPPSPRLGSGAAPKRTETANMALGADKYYEKITSIQQNMHKR